MRILRQWAIALLTIMTGAMSSLAQATPVTVWNYDLLTKFAGVNTFGSGGGTQIETDTQVSWGATGGDVFTNTGNPSTNRSGITIADTDTAPGGNDPAADNISGLVNTNALSIPGIGLGAWITHHNNPISGTFATLLTSQISSTLTLFPNTPPLGGQEGPTTLTFTVYFAETPNVSGTCAAPSPAGNPCNDIFALNSVDAFNQSFVFDGETYFVSTFPLAGQGLGTFLPLSSAECAAAGANDGCVGFTTIEGQDTTVRFGFAITSEPVTVPEPGTLALLGAGLGVAGFLSRRRRKA